MKEKSILEQALLQVKTLEEAVKANAKGILASTMKQELNELLKESMEDEDMEVKEQPSPNEDENDVPDVDKTTEDDDDDLEDDSDDEDDEDDEDDNLNIPSDTDDTDMSYDDFDTTPDTDMSADDFGSEDSDNVLDMTKASNSEVLKVFKSMKPEDGIVVKKDGNNIELETGEDDYIIKLDDHEESDLNEQGEDDYLDSAYEDRTHLDDDENPFKTSDDFDDDFEDEFHEEEETVYEIDLDDEGEMETSESARTIGFGYHGGLKSKNVYKAGNKREEMNEEVSRLKKQNGEYKKALVLFKEKLNEIAVFSANLSYATRLFTELSTTKQEKMNILKRFDSVSTMNEAKTLFNTIKSELETKKPITETVVNKISFAPSTSSSSELITESKAYENPQFKRMKELMGKIK